MLVLDEAAVRRHLTLPALIPAMARALTDLSAGRVIQPVRQVIPIERHRGFMWVMPAYAGGLGAKLVTLFPDNRGLPTHHALILLFDPETGAPAAVLDGRLITELRTAAVSAVATQHLSRRDARTLAILGAGIQARSHLEALRLVREFTEVRVWSPKGAAAFAEQHGITPASSAEAAVRDADVIVTATSSRTPVLLREWVAAGTHINSVGAPRPEWRELDDATVAAGRFYVDSREAARQESGDAIAAPHITAELGEVLAHPSLGRSGPDEITVFKSVGLAVEDLVAAEMVYRAATGGEAKPA